MKNIKKISASILVAVVCVALLCVITNEYSKSNQQVPENQDVSGKLEEDKAQLQDTKGDYFPTNENGETYGTSVLTEDGEYVDPDLIEAIGDGDVEGYVRSEDVFGHDNTYDPKNPNKKISIPLYEVDGFTVIGEFIIENRDTMRP
ncbi:MAG: hypothetical protein ACRC3Y_17270 [Romboutsia sp.]|uniref:hypothetical protein n=1 Tax=Romboutsia sp. TaxID=1965302 RepID=UPI003F39E57B